MYSVYIYIGIEWRERADKSRHSTRGPTTVKLYYNHFNFSKMQESFSTYLPRQELTVVQYSFVATSRRLPTLDASVSPVTSRRANERRQLLACTDVCTSPVTF